MLRLFETAFAKVGLRITEHIGLQVARLQHLETGHFVLSIHTVLCGLKAL